MKLEIDETDFGFVTNILCRAMLTFESLGCNNNVCAANRDRYREDAKMARQAREMMYDAKKESKAASRRARGDCAKLREAIDYLCERMADVDATFDPSEVECLRAALSVPPRNCDLPLVVDSPADNNADKAWLVFKCHNPDAYFDVPGLL